jgi:hypothetical protein
VVTAVSDVVVTGHDDEVELRMAFEEVQKDEQRALVAEQMNDVTKELLKEKELAKIDFKNLTQESLDRAKRESLVELDKELDISLSRLSEIEQRLYSKADALSLFLYAAVVAVLINILTSVFLDLIYSLIKSLSPDIQFFIKMGIFFVAMWTLAKLIEKIIDKFLLWVKGEFKKDTILNKLFIDLLKKKSQK